MNDYTDANHVIDFFMSYSALNPTGSPSGGAQFTATKMNYPGGSFPGGPPANDTIQAGISTPASGNFNVDLTDKVTGANFPQIAGGTLTILDVVAGHTYVCNIVSYSNNGGAGAKTRYVCTVVSGPPSTAITGGSKVLVSMTTGQRVILAAVAPNPYDPGQYFD
jgi:hypothetical protein